MKSTFDDRWRRLVGVAREARASEPPLPPAPVHRVREWLGLGLGLGRGRGPGRGGVAVPGEAAELWFRYGLRGLATSVVVLAASVWFARAGMAAERGPGALQPGLEQAVVEDFWLL